MFVTRSNWLVVVPSVHVTNSIRQPKFSWVFCSVRQFITHLYTYINIVYIKDCVWRVHRTMVHKVFHTKAMFILIYMMNSNGKTKHAHFYYYSTLSCAIFTYGYVVAAANHHLLNECQSKIFGNFIWKTMLLIIIMNKTIFCGAASECLTINWMYIGFMCAFIHDCCV